MSAPIQCRAVGIDLGTTFSVIAHLDPAGRPTTIPNAEGDLTTPSVVLFDADSIVVGKEALKAAVMEPERVALFAKRDMGCEVYSHPINGERLSPEVIQSLFIFPARFPTGAWIERLVILGERVLIGLLVIDLARASCQSPDTVAAILGVPVDRGFPSDNFLYFSLLPWYKI